MFQWCALCLCESGFKGLHKAGKGPEGPSRGGAALLEQKLAHAAGLAVPL